MNNYLVIPDTKSEIDKLISDGDVKLLLPFKFFSVGFNTYFSVSDIKLLDTKVFLYINRLLSSSEIDGLRDVLQTMGDYVEGLVFEDIGLLSVLGESSFIKVLYLSHSMVSLSTVNSYNRYVDSCVISPDVTKEQILYIKDNSTKEVSLYSYGLLNLHYSRRLLNKSYCDNYGIEYENNIEIKNTDYTFITNENDEGTIIYLSDIYSDEGILDKSNIKYSIINLYNIGYDKYKDKNTVVVDGFLNKETIYKVKGDK